MCTFLILLPARILTLAHLISLFLCLSVYRCLPAFRPFLSCNRPPKLPRYPLYTSLYPSFTRLTARPRPPHYPPPLLLSINPFPQNLIPAASIPSPRPTDSCIHASTTTTNFSHPGIDALRPPIVSAKPNFARPPSLSPLSPILYPPSHHAPPTTRLPPLPPSLNLVL